MPRLRTFLLPLAAIILAGGAAQAQSHSGQAPSRSGQALPAPAPSSQPPATPAQNAQGPKNGFPDNRGIERAMDRANEHARFLRNDSTG